MSLQRAQPPQTLSLVSSVFVRKACVDELSKKMASAESIGACSLDVDRSESSLAVGHHEEMTASACSLKSASLILSNGCKGEDEEQKRFRSSAFLYITPDGKAIQLQEESSSVKLPSYLGISCAISGYKNYSRFCHSRDNSPARSGLPNSHASGPVKPPKDDTDNHLPVEGRDSSYSCSRYHKASYSSQNGTSSSRQTFVSSQEIMIHSNSPGREATSLTNGSLHKVVSNGHNALSNGHGETVVDACETKSLVQQRIESLFGHSNLQVPKMRTSRSATKAIDGSLSARSPSCPPQAIRSQSRSPPVFRHITRDFRDQLQHSSPNEPVLPHVLARHPFVKCSSQPPESSKQHSASQFHLEAPSMKLVPLERKEAAGHAFLRKIEDEKEKICKHIQEVQKDLASGGILEDTCGRLLSAIGKANLLISQKFEQFRGLCEKNIKQDRSEPFPTTSEDLAGFWDMVMLQVNDVNKSFEEIGHLRENSWKEIVPYQTSPIHTKSKKISKTLQSSKSPIKSSEASRARDAHRQQLLEAKRKGRQQQKSPTDDIAIFVPQKPE